MTPAGRVVIVEVELHDLRRDLGDPTPGHQPSHLRPAWSRPPSRLSLGPAPGVAAGAGRRPLASECGTTRPVTFALGVLIFPTDRAIRPDELAREAEARGFES